MNKPPVFPTRITSLDAVRGVAALIVLFCHLQHSFLPHFFGGIAETKEGTWGLAPVSFFLNGGEAVALFFVLSGFVLTQRFFESRKILDIPDSILKRWPRLAGPVVLVSLCSGFLMGFGFYHNIQVSTMNGSWWLKHGFDWAPRGLQDVIHALKQGVAGTFFTGISDYNGAFWTMHYEFLGSIAVYSLAFFVILFSKRFDWRLILVGLLALWIREVIRFPFLASFILGTLLALVYTRFPKFVWENAYSLWIGGIFCMLIGGFTISENDLPTRFYQILGSDSVEGRLCVRYFLYSVIALFFLSSALWSPQVRDFLSRPLLRKIGHLSFPIYLIHTPVICSVGSWVYLALHPQGAAIAATSAIFASILVTFALSIPLAAFDDLWLLIVRRITPFKTLWRLYSGKTPALGQTATSGSN